ncbi:MAG: AP-3 complex subunit delta [Thelocarpon impressellum]|nr:MAG: AP-3 complex subunit delta [Thelocarpon impressellum]
MDVKATALLKLVYLEMFGNDMAWASFHVLEVMSSPKYLHKRVGYLGAVQTFGPNTDVLMLATNLLKKDLTSPLQTTMALPLVTIPHIITSSLALSLLSDLLPRLNHSHPVIRKKTIVTLYRLALVYPETLRPAWPKIKERLMDENEDLTVTVAIVNVVCELGWRRPQDFLPLAPRLFDLLVDGGNNWMAIKIIKLFATLTPLEPRLVRKLLPPLTNIIKTTLAMSLLYECINGIIQGGILESSAGSSEGEEIALLCVGKLRGMIAADYDRNLKYVALLAFHTIVVSHPHLVSLHQDAILECVDDADISIRLRALDLVVSMVDGDNLVSVVGRLMRQLRNSPAASGVDDPANECHPEAGIEPAADSDEGDPEESLQHAPEQSDSVPPLPADYRVGLIERILDMCSRETYANIADFDWYIEVLVQLIKLAPASGTGLVQAAEAKNANPADTHEQDVSYKLGSQLLNVAVRVKSVRTQATRAAESIVLSGERERTVTLSSGDKVGVYGPAAWIVGEYAGLLARPSDTLSSLLQPSTLDLPAQTLSIYLQAIPKIFAVLTGTGHAAWDRERKSMTSLLIARVVHFLETLTAHPDLEVQERAVEILELMRLAAEAVSAHDISHREDALPEAPLILTQVIPSLFGGLDLNPVAPGAQKKVPLPGGLDLDSPLNPDLQSLLRVADIDIGEDSDFADFHRYYNERPTVAGGAEPAANRLKLSNPPSPSYQQADDADPEVTARRRAERHERHKDDPFYIGSEGGNSGVSTPFHNIIKNSNGADLDIDSIPIMELDLDAKGPGPSVDAADMGGRYGNITEPRKYDIAADETIPFEDGPDESRAGQGGGVNADASPQSGPAKGKKSILQVDSSGLGGFSLEADEKGQVGGQYDDRQEEEDLEMARAIKEVERLRLEMQRASERIQAAKGIPPEGTLVKKKKKKAKAVAAGGPEEAQVVPAEATVVRKKKKKKKAKAMAEGAVVDATAPATEANAAETEASASTIAKPKAKTKKKKIRVKAEGEAGEGAEVDETVTT